MKTLTITAALLAFGIPVALATLPAITKPKPAPVTTVPTQREPEPVLVQHVPLKPSKPKDNLIRRPPASWRK